MRFADAPEDFPVDVGDDSASRYEPLTHACLIERKARLHPDAEMAFDGSTRISYGQCYEQAWILVRELSMRGIKAGDKAIICMPNWVEFCVSYAACQILGLTVVPLIPTIKKKNSLCIARQVEPSLVFVSSKEHARLFAQGSAGALLVGVRLVSDGGDSSDDGAAGGGEGRAGVDGAPADETAVAAAVAAGHDGSILSYERMVAAPAQPMDLRWELPRESETIIYTSGSSREPKGVMLKGSALYFASFRQSGALEARCDDVFITPITFAHVFGIGAGLLIPLLVGARIVLCDRYQPERVLGLIASERVSVHFGVPTMFIREMKDDSFGREDMSSLRTGIVAGSLCPTGLIGEFEQKTGCRLLCAYGLTETSATLTTTRLDDDDYTRSSTVGRPVEGVEVALLDTREDAGYDRPVGEVICRTPGVMEGYYKDDDLSAKAFTPDGWFRTGDLGSLGADGTLRIVGRCKNTINRGGFNIYPEEIEAFYRNNENLLDVCLLEYPDSELGERTSLFVQLAPGAYASGEELRVWSAEGLEKFKIPDRIVFVESMPRLGSGKVDRQLLRKILAELKLPGAVC